MNTIENATNNIGLSKIITACIIFASISGSLIGCGSTASSKSSNSTNIAQTTNATITSNKPVTNNTSSFNTSTTKNTIQTIKATTTSNKPVTNNISRSSSTNKQASAPVYYIKGSKVYYLNKSASNLKKSSHILTITLKQAKALGMKQFI